MPARKTVTLHAVQRRGWLCYDEYCFRPEDAADGDAESADEVGPSYPLRCFLSREKAEAHRRELELQERHQVDSPFRFGGDGSDLADHSTVPFEEFRARLRALGLP